MQNVDALKIKLVYLWKESSFGHVLWNVIKLRKARFFKIFLALSFEIEHFHSLYTPLI